MDTSEMIVAALAAVGGILLRWRSALVEAPGLPLWHFLRRQGITRDDANDILSAKTVIQAELGCAVCGSRAECRARLASGGSAAPPDNCPNARLFEDFGIAVDKSRK